MFLVYFLIFSSFWELIHSANVNMLKTKVNYSPMDSLTFVRQVYLKAN